MDFKDQWNSEMALQILLSETIDSKTWADAIKWLILYGPEEIKRLLLEASTDATSNFFPDLKPAGFREDGQPYYDLANLAAVLDADPESLQKSLSRIEGETGFSLVVDEEDVLKFQ
jgi:hypothetical protein